MHDWREVTARSTWQALLEQSDRSAVQQSWAYGAAVEAAGHVVCRLQWQAGAGTRATVQLLRRRLPLGFGVTLALRGPVWLGDPPDPEEEDRLLRALVPWVGQSALVWQPDDTRACSRRAGARRVWTGGSVVELDLAPGLAALRSRLHGKWRNMLKAAEANELWVRSGRGGKHLHWLVAETERQRRTRGYAGPAPLFTHRLAEASGVEALCLVAEHGNVPVAGVLLLRHGRSATYQLAATTPEGRALRCHHRLLWVGIEALVNAGVTRLDLGLVDTVRNPGIARFKLGTGGTPRTLAGSYLVPPRLRQRLRQPL